MALSLTTLFTFSTNSSDSQDRVIAYAHGNCWADWDYNSLSEEWEATYTRFAYAGVYAPYGVSGWWEAYAYVDQNGKTKPITTYEFGVDDGIGKRVYTAQYWGTMPVMGDRAALLLVWAEPGQIPMINHGVDITLSREHI